MSTQSSDDNPITDSEWGRIRALFPRPESVSHLAVTELRDNGYVQIGEYPNLTEDLMELMNMRLKESGVPFRFVATPDNLEFNERNLDIQRIR